LIAFEFLSRTPNVILPSIARADSSSSFTFAEKSFRSNEFTTSVLRANCAFV
jgi:hypothetical protein